MLVLEICANFSSMDVRLFVSFAHNYNIEANIRDILSSYNHVFDELLFT